MKVRKAVIPAGGLGTRFLPITRSIPKEMLPLLNKPIIQYSIEEAVACGVEVIYIVTAPGKKSIEDYFALQSEPGNPPAASGKTHPLEEISRLSRMSEIRYILQEKPLGLGHAVFTAREAVDEEPFLLFLPDDLFQQRENLLKKMLDIHHQYHSCVIAVKKVIDQEIPRYGIIDPEELARRIYRVKALVEKPPVSEAPSNLAIMGRYVLTPDIFTALENTPPGRNGEIQLTDALQRLLEKHPINAYEFEGEQYDCGTLPGWLETNLALA
ncbi:UTP--glucose-1-phosphate uridylyltransferase, partial [Chloroflexota bacterium]